MGYGGQQAIVEAVEPPSLLPRAVNGRFVTGAGYPRLWGSRTAWTAEKFAEGVAAYLAECVELKRAPTVSGCIVSLGMTRPTFEQAAAGDLAEGNEADKRLYLEAAGALHALREAWLEGALTEKAFATGGVIFSLKNQFASRWRDDSYIHTNGAGAGGPSVAVTIQVAGMAQRVDVDVQRVTGATVDAVSWAESMAAEGDRLRSSVPALPAWDDDADEGDCPFD